MKLSQFSSIWHLINHRIVINHRNTIKIMDVLSYNAAANTVLVEYQFRPGENTTQTVSFFKIRNWITKAAQLNNFVQ